jgi:hypothetical protein
MFGFQFQTMSLYSHVCHWLYHCRTKNVEKHFFLKKYVEKLIDDYNSECKSKRIASSSLWASGGWGDIGCLEMT